MKDVPIPKRRSYLIPLGHKDISWSSMQKKPPSFIFMTGICALEIDWGRFYRVLTGKCRKIYKIVVKYIKISVLSNGKSEDRKNDLLFIQCFRGLRICIMLYEPHFRKNSKNYDKRFLCSQILRIQETLNLVFRYYSLT